MFEITGYRMSKREAWGYRDRILSWGNSGPIAKESQVYATRIAKSGLRKGTAPTGACPIQLSRIEGFQRASAKLHLAHRHSVLSRQEGNTRAEPVDGAVKR
jgi:hypothetical protein